MTKLMMLTTSKVVIVDAGRQTFCSTLTLREIWLNVTLVVTLDVWIVASVIMIAYRTSVGYAPTRIARLVRIIFHVHQVPVDITV